MTNKTISLIDQIRASQAMYQAALENLESLTDREPSLIMASLTCARLADVLDCLSGAQLADVVARLNLDVPIVEDLDKKVAESAESGLLNMQIWHCGTTHCRAGWAVTLAGDAGAKIEDALGSEMAGRLIYEASTGRPAPNFYASQADALADIRRCAALGDAA